MDLDARLAHAPACYRHEAASRFPAVTQDLAEIVDEATPAEQVRDAIVKGGGKLLQRVELFDIYRGPQIPAGKKQLAYTLTYQALERTLTDEQVSALKTRIQERLEEDLGAQLRG